MRPDWDTLVEALDRRVADCAGLPLQVRPRPHGRLRDPLTGRRALLNTWRAGRTRPPSRPGPAGCPYCRGETPPTLFYVPDEASAGAGDSGGFGVHGAVGVGDEGDTHEVARALVVEQERESLDAAGVLVAGGRTGTWELLEGLADRRRPAAGGLTVPVVHPAEPWLARVFFNATPIVVDPRSKADSFVVSVPEPYHALDLAGRRPAAHRGEPPEAAAGPKGTMADAADRVPLRVLEAVLASWALLEAWAERHGLVSVPFINGGKDRASGQSVECFHGQLVALGPDDRPPALDSAAQADAGGCPICALAGDRTLGVAEVGGCFVVAHPAPMAERTLIIAPRAHLAGLSRLPGWADLARSLSLAGGAMAHVLAGLPAYNLVVHTGAEIGHLHLELVPRTGVSVAGGFELATGFSVLARDPTVVAAECRAWAAEHGPAETYGAQGKRAASAGPRV